MKIKRLKLGGLLVKDYTDRQYFQINRIFRKTARYQTQWKGIKLPASAKTIDLLEQEFGEEEIEIHPDLERDIHGAVNEFYALPEDIKRIHKIQQMKSHKIKDHKFKTKPWSHQKRGFRIVINVSGVLLLWDMRTGKTYTIANAIRFLKKKGEIKRALVVCPKDVRSVWVEDVAKHTDLKCLILGTRTAQQLKALENDNQITVVDGPNIYREYGSATIYITNFAALRNPKLLRALKDFNFDVLVIDEIHMLRHTGAAKTQAMIELKRWIPRRYGLTGTFIPKSPENAYSQMGIINTYVFTESEEEFGNKYCIYKNIFGNKVYKKPRERTQKDLWRRIDALADKVAIEECHDMPERLYAPVEVYLTAEQKKAHLDLLENLSTQIAGQTIDATVLTKTMMLVQITSGFKYLPDGTAYRFKNNPKLEKLQYVLEQVIKRGRKICIWAFHHETVRLIETLLKKEAIGYALVSGKDGRMNTKRRHEQKWRFQNEDECTVMLANPTMLGLGTDLSQAKYMLFFENRHLLDERYQAEARNYDNKALKLHGKVVVIDFLAKDTIDEPIYECLLERKDYLKFINGKVLNDLYLRLAAQ